MARCLTGLAILALAAAPAAAQEPATRFFVEGLGGVVVPTFDISDVAQTGAAFGSTLGYRLNDRWTVMGEFDYGAHKDQATGDADINTLHYMGKLGYTILQPQAEQGWEALLNLGAGAVTFDVPGPSSFTYFAINAGAKVAYNLNRSFAFVLSPQGDIAFSDESEILTDNAWVWPVTAGLRVKF